MFEKDLYALIRGLRNHKGNERAYIDGSIKECQKEIRGPDMDAKATALLKLVYLEMFGHDMSWASFHVLEVMSSAKYLQKRVGYLGAVQSFRPDTEVLMLGENLLKKDIMSPHQPTIALALQTIPHVINPSMANSLLADLLPRLSHSSPSIRKKTIVTLYRLALVYPETLRPAWPKIKERLLDEQEDPSVTAAIINVICELGWRRPQDFLPLAPRLFELLVNGGNNWMAIKIIKLFAVLTPLEPRLIRKLLPPLTTLIKTTPAMSLLYECINGIIQGGILDGSEGTVDGDEVARLCVGKLRGMLVVEGDPNLKYVALLAMTRIVGTHPQLVAQHADVILECVDDPDISIRSRALELVVGMVDPTNLVMTVERLLRQLRDSRQEGPSKTNGELIHNDEITPADLDEEDAQESLRRHEVRSDQLPPLPDDYRNVVIRKILDLCSRDTYANINDFDWYVGVLVELVRHCPVLKATDGHDQDVHSPSADVAELIGKELQNVAVRVKLIRAEATAAAQSLLLIERRHDLFPSSGTDAYAVLGPAAWIAGEYAQLLPDPDGTLTALTHPSCSSLPSSVLAIFLQAIPKVFTRLASHTQSPWTSSRKAHASLLAARIIHFLEPLALHPDLNVQERAAEFLELLRLASEALSSHPVSTDDLHSEGPLLITQALPVLFAGQDLNPVAPAAIRKVPIDSDLDLSKPINDRLQSLLGEAESDTDASDAGDEVYRLYREKPKPVISTSTSITAASTLEVPGSVTSYQRPETKPMTEAEMARLKAERKERYQNDPFYIDPDRLSGTSTPLHNIIKASNGDEELDVDSIPIMELPLDIPQPSKTRDGSVAANDSAGSAKQASKAKRPKRIEITADETLDDAHTSSDNNNSLSTPRSAVASIGNGGKAKKSLLELDSSRLASLSLTDDYDDSAAAHWTARPGSVSDVLYTEDRAREEEEMRNALKEVERRRLEMLREQERVDEAAGVEVKVKRKKKPRRAVGHDEPGIPSITGDDVGPAGDVVGNDDGEAQEKVVKKIKRKKKKAAAEGDVDDRQAEEGVMPNDAPSEVKVKKKKKRVVVLDE